VTRRVLGPGEVIRDQSRRWGLIRWELRTLGRSLSDWGDQINGLRISIEIFCSFLPIAIQPLAT
jgi:hypothetical protein